MPSCNVCFRRCNIEDDSFGRCKARRTQNGTVVPDTYGRFTALALDPIEKKPLYHFYPGSMIVSAGGYGCNLACPFCQNHDISLSEYSSLEEARIPHTEYYSPEELADICEHYKSQGNIGVAFTYNEPLISYEYIIDTAKLLQKKDLKTVIVTNGSATKETLDKVAPFVDAMNVDLKSFDEKYYKNVLKGDLKTTKEFIESAVHFSHVEVTTLIVPGDNDSEEEMRNISSWLRGIGENSGKDIPLHINRFFPRSLYSDRQPTEIETIYRLAEIARENLKYVHEGNV
ncbi:MAG: AmmeMemoRadiSam system radical SAM enzyme [Eubacterium sp.]|nr:AmmeMemoRadiSam system radical SAM enzyme [Eubacterium sp.]